MDWKEGCFNPHTTRLNTVLCRAVPYAFSLNTSSADEPDPIDRSRSDRRATPCMSAGGGPGLRANRWVGGLGLWLADGVVWCVVHKERERERDGVMEWNW